jgi:hypothetical protein
VIREQREEREENGYRLREREKSVPQALVSIACKAVSLGLSRE